MFYSPSSGLSFLFFYASVPSLSMLPRQNEGPRIKIDLCDGLWPHPSRVATSKKDAHGRHTQPENIEGERWREGEGRVVPKERSGERRGRGGGSGGQGVRIGRMFWGNPSHFCQRPSVLFFLPFTLPSFSHLLSFSSVLLFFNSGPPLFSVGSGRGW